MAAMTICMIRMLLVATVLAAATSPAWAISGGPAGAQASATVTWIDPVNFRLTNVKLSDTSCDGNSVHFTIQQDRNGVDVSNSRRENNSGCNSLVNLPDIAVRTGDIPQNIALYVCVNHRFSKDTCAYTTNADNPFI